MHDYIVELMGCLIKCGPMTWYHAIRLGWASGEYSIGKAGVRRRVLLRAIDRRWIAFHGDRLAITPCGRREFKDALRAV